MCKSPTLLNPNVSFSIPIRRPSYLGSDPAKVNFTLKCNEFINEPQTAANPITRKGLVIGEGVQVRAPNGLVAEPNSIGGESAFNTTLNGPAYPNANVWPTSSSRLSFPDLGGIPVNVNDDEHGWLNSPNWLSIENNSGNLVKYYRFDNEFVGRGTAIGSNVQLLTPTLSELVITDANENPPSNAVEACFNFTDDQVLFPARVAVVDTSFVLARKSELIDLPILGQAVPNPAAQETRIGVYLPHKTKMAVLQIFEVATGRVLQNIRLQERGKLEVELDVSKAPAGVYGYRLLVDGILEATQKMLVSH